MTDPLDPLNPEPAPPQQDSIDSDEISLDPAQQSLADALRITYRFIQVVMVALVILFVGSGFDTVGEGQRGIELLFGKVRGTDLPSGQQFHWPYPVGELVKVSVGQRTLRIDDSFMPDLTDNQRARALESLAGSFRTLNPASDGALITGDGNLAHAQWTAVYKVEDATTFASTMHPENTDQIVRFAIERAAVHTIAELPVDGFLGQLSSSASNETIEEAVRASAQRALDSMQSGVRIDRITLDQRIPPLAIYDEYQSVSTSEAEAIRAREEAEQQSREALTNIAGLAHERILDLIDEYELALSTSDDARAEQILDSIDALMDPQDPGAETQVSGLVSQIISDARRYRTDVVTKAQAEAERFQAKLQQYRTNPDVFIASEWTSAYTEFLDFASAEIFSVPRGASEVWTNLNPDPDIASALERERNSREASETMQTRFDAVLEGYRKDRQERKRRQLEQESNQ
ncbi:MAG: SPFH domain-containing protein [Phycisphaerales bacterium JB043]